MRMRFHQTEFPTREQILKYAKGSVIETKILIAVSLLYSTWYTIADTYGFDLVRFSYEELEIIIHKQSFNNWVLNFTSYEKTSNN